ncbi:uncharacterized protein B0H18DRAFT_106074 [Fomitopsis serialis]|uniref:uncharacterized protein n=1 Tax=Fomitopsis serialis TaxID=139415 RepID=UPI0020088E4E|nr:uncharacterized protein B0H18DRAFT_106074 [Neoantrodia serialis]KAH9915223.1 hypothetical protein B0H18DRAFT_106074 [Neoantrodia serialis]
MFAFTLPRLTALPFAISRPVRPFVQTTVCDRPARPVSLCTSRVHPPSTEPARHYVASPAISYGSETLFYPRGGYLGHRHDPHLHPELRVQLLRLRDPTGATLDDNTSQCDSPEDLTFTIGGTEYTFTANSRICPWPCSVSASAPSTHACSLTRFPQLNTAIVRTTDYVDDLVRQATAWRAGTGPGQEPGKPPPDEQEPSSARRA